MTKHTHLALLCAVVIIGLLMPPVMAVEVAPGASQDYLLPGGNEHPDVDGNMIVWERSLLRGPKDIYSMTTSGSDIRSLTNDNASQERPSISGDYVVWQDNRSGDWDIYLYSFSENTTSRLTNDTADQWLPVIHGNYAVWYDNREGSTDIVLYDIGAGEEKALIDCNPALGTDVTRFKPTLSDEYVAWEETGAGILLYEIATGTSRAVSPSSMPQSWPSIAGDVIAWEDYRWGAAWESAIYLHSIGTGEELQLTTQSSEQVSPALTESLVAWEDKRDGLWSIYMYDLSDGVEEMSVPTTGGEQLYPAASGNTIVWQKNRGENAKLCVYTYIPGDPTQTVTEIEIEPSTAMMEIGEELKFNATCYDQDGNVTPGLKVTWSCSNTTVGLIDPGGYFNAAAAGTATITAATAGVSSTANVTVNATELILESITVTPATATLEINGTEQFSATALDQFGNAMTGVSVAWTSSNETVGTVDENGLFTALAEGTADVTATAGGVTGSAAVTVSAEEPVLDSITVAPTTATLEINGTEQFSATALDQFGSAMTGVSVAWASGNETVGTINETGLFTALAEGTATITATAENKSAEATVTVTAEEPVTTSITVTPLTAIATVNDTLEFTATVRDQFGGELSDVEVTWTSSNETVGTINETGTFTALAEGIAAITATADGVSGSAAITVNPEEQTEPVLTSIRVTPSGATLAIGDTQRFMVTAFDQDGTAMPDVEVTWASSDETVGTIGADGVFNALAEGTANVTATAENITGTAAVTVNATESALAMVAVSPSAITLAVNDTHTFSAVAFDLSGNVVPDAEITWASSDETVGTIGADGAFNALAQGTATITAAGDNVTGTSTVTVNSDAPVLTSIAVTPSAITLAAGDTETFTATALDQDGITMPDVEVTWASSDETVGTVGADGAFNALAKGAATITATAEGVTGTAAATVTDVSSGVVISPSEIILDVGGSRQFTATVYDPEGNVTPGAVVTWSSDDDTVGTITADGLFNALAEGTATITASVDGTDETGTATVMVQSTSSAPGRIRITPSELTLAAGNNMTFAATVLDQDGLEVSDAEVTWASSDETVGVIDADGVFTALEEGTVTLTASANETSGSAQVTVEPSLPAPARIEISPATATIPPGETREFTATVFDQRDSEMDWIRVAWSCSDTEIGTIDRAGLFGAFAEGSADVTASAGGVEGTAAVTVSATVVPEPTPGNGGGSTNGGGGGGDSSPSFSAGIRENLRSGETFTFSELTTTSVSSVNVTAASTIPKMMLTVKKAKAPSAAEPPASDVYEYIEITPQWVGPNQIGNATVFFSVPADWLESHNATAEDVVLMRYVDGAWQPLETEVLGEENGKYNFRATTPGFSTFAIAASPVSVIASAEELNVTAEVTGTPEETGNVTTEPTTVPATTPAAPLVYAPLLAPLAFLLWARKKN